MGITVPRPAMRRGESRRIHHMLRELDRLTFWGVFCGMTREDACNDALAIVRDPDSEWVVVDNYGNQAAPTKGAYGDVTRALRAMVVLQRTYGAIFSVRVKR